MLRATSLRSHAAGYIGTGLWTPQFVLDYPEVLREAHYDFVRAGSDVVQALQVGEEAISTSPCAIHVFCLDCSVCLHDTAVCTYSPSIVLGGSIQSLDWTGGLDWWTGPVDWTGGLD